MQNDTIERTTYPESGFGATDVSNDWLLGTWRLYRADAALDFAPGVRMEFADAGVLRYHIDVGGTDQVVDLLYRVDGDTLHTENLVESHTMSVLFAREGEDVLALDFGGAFAWLMREYSEMA
ncbi:MAG: hypothetical protein ABJB74_02620 [Gemmatimonas sp.]